MIIGIMKQRQSIMEQKKLEIVIEDNPIDNVQKTVGLALLGLGTVGGGTYRVLTGQLDEIQKRLGCRIEIRHILVRNLKKASLRVQDSRILTNRWEDVIEDDGVDIVVELMGGMEPAYTYIREAMERGKHVVTANKDLLAEHGPTLLELALNKGVDFMFEAAVAGGIPIIMPLEKSLAGNHLTEIMGIVNGTTNFILTKMSEEGMDYREALIQATELGYAEADPTADVDGLDAGRKVAILASLAFHCPVYFHDVHVEGMSMISAKDIRYASQMGRTIKLVGVARDTDTGVEAYVCPMLLPKSHPLSSVNDSFNAVFVHGDAVGDAMFFGRGAGDLPTASAVTGDILSIAENILHGSSGRIGQLLYKKRPMKRMEDTYNRYFLRLHVEDRCGVLAELTEIFARYEVSVAQIIQREHQKDDLAEVVVITSLVREGDFQTAIEELSYRTSVKKISRMIRVYE